MNRKMQSFKAFINEPKTPVIVYGGRFQPFHAGHFSVYEYLVKTFSRENVFVATSNKTSVEDNSYFNFEDKKKIITEMFPSIPSDKIIRCVNPAFAPVEIFKLFDGNIVYIAACGDKDESRYTSSKYFDRYPLDGKDPIEFSKVKDKLRSTAAKKGYYIVVPMMEGGLSGTEVRKRLATSDKTEFKKLYGKNNDVIMQLISDRIKNENK